MGIKKFLPAVFQLKNEHERLDYKRYLVGFYVYLFALVSHIMLFILFLVLRVTPLYLFNIASITIFIVCFSLNRKKYFIAAFLLSFLEVIAHAWFATFLMGWNAGFHYFIFISGAGVFFIIMSTSVFQKIALFSFAILSYLSLAVLTYSRIPEFVFDANILSFTNLSIILGTFIALSFLGNYHTRAVGKAEADLESERLKLELQNNAIKEELRMARNIQMQNLPKESPFSWLSFFYKPMYQIGGDFFDFFNFPDGKIGIFISDVSGHGVSAAFVTSMLKSYSLQYALQTESPAEFLRGLNGFLGNRTGGHFITAFYGILDKKNNQMIYANAGHNLPFIITSSEVSQIECSTSSPPLVVLNNEELKSLQRDFVDNEIGFKKQSKLFLYTDGLTEAINIERLERNPNKDLKDFEYDKLIPTLVKLSDSSSSKMLEKIISELFIYRGIDSFDDDICVICLDV